MPDGTLVDGGCVLRVAGVLFKSRCLHLAIKPNYGKKSWIPIGLGKKPRVNTHGSKNSVSQQQGALATTMVTATKWQKTIHKTTALHVHHTFLYISEPSLHNYDMKLSFM